MSWKTVEVGAGGEVLNLGAGVGMDVIGLSSETIIKPEGIPQEKVKTKSVGDVKSKKKGSGARYNGGKANYALIPLATLEDEAQVWAYGEAKYAAWNWAKGMAWSVPFACAMRHIAAWQKGEDIDKESGFPHLAHAMCNLRMLTLYSKTFPEGDDRPKEWMKGL